MKRKHISINVDSYAEHKQRTVIHEAGHAVAIYIGNQQKNLPPVYFSICLSDEELEVSEESYLSKTHGHCFAKIEGGRLIHSLPTSFATYCLNFSVQRKLVFTQAFEADIVNLLVGPLAEARYVSLRDNELINPRLVNFHSLYNYGGSSDIDVIYRYLECFISDDLQRHEKITELFHEAFLFITQPRNWSAINALADYILSANKNKIEYSEIALVLDNYAPVEAGITA